MQTRTIFIVDDNTEFRVSAQWWLSSAGYDVVDFADPEVALDALRARPPNGDACMLLDVRMPGMSGMDLHDRLNAQGVRLPIIYMTGHGDVPLAVEAMRKGAVTFLEKPFADEALERALDLAFSRCRDPLPARDAPPAPVAAAQAPDEPTLQWQRRFARLTPREREVLDWVLKEKLNKTISDLMGISIKTVELHRSRVMQKLEANSITHLVKMVVSGRVV